MAAVLHATTGPVATVAGMSRPLRVTRAHVPALVLALTLAPLSGCGSSSSKSNGTASKSATEVLAAAKAAAAGAASAHVAGAIVDEGKPISLDMKLVSGKGGKGRITLEGLSIDLIQIGKSVYINGSKAFYTHVAGAAAAQLLQGKWLKAPASSSSFASLASLTNLGKLIDTTLASHGKLASTGARTINGQKAVGVTDTTKGGTLYVAATGTAYPLEIVKSGASGGKISFDHWNQPVTLNPPAGAININQLQSGH
jgi:hypothetical protein